MILQRKKDRIERITDEMGTRWTIDKKTNSFLEIKWGEREIPLK